MLSPFLPFSSQKLHEYLGFEGIIENFEMGNCHSRARPKTGGTESFIHRKLDDEIIEKETQKLGH